MDLFFTCITIEIIRQAEDIYLKLCFVFVLFLYIFYKLHFRIKNDQTRTYKWKMVNREKYATEKI